MIDLSYYCQALLSSSELEMVLKYYSKKKFDNLRKASYFFSKLELSNLDWIKANMDKAYFLQVLNGFGEKLDALLPDLAKKQEMIYSKLTYQSTQMDFLQVRDGSSVTCVCPSCQDAKEKAFIIKPSGFRMIKCNHRSSCGFKGDLIKAYSTYYNISYYEALIDLADSLGIDFEADEVHVGVVNKAPLQIIKTPTIVQSKEIIYETFDVNKKMKLINLESYLDKFNKMDEVQQFKFIATMIYRYSLTKTKQFGKINYYHSIGISRKANPILSSKVDMIENLVGWLYVGDIPKLVTHLIEKLGVEPLIKYGVVKMDKDKIVNKLLKSNSIEELVEKGIINPSTHKVPYSFNKEKSMEDLIDDKLISIEEVPVKFLHHVEKGICVIPNFDLYTNMCTGLKYRQVELASWQKSSFKEVEFSHGRCANPLPYHLTRESMIRKEIKFRFFEGQKDLHSLPCKLAVCDLAIPGVNGINEETLGLFKDRDVELWFDQDKAGQEGALKLKELLEKAGARVTIKTWDISLGSDVNEVLQKGNIQKII